MKPIMFIFSLLVTLIFSGCLSGREAGKAFGEWLNPSTETQLSSEIRSLNEVEPNSAAGKVVYNTIPEELNGKGLFFINKHIVKRNKIESIITTDYLYNQKTLKLTKRNMGELAKFDYSGNMILFEGNIDQGPSVKIDYKYDGKGNNIEKMVYVKKLNEYQFFTRISYKYNDIQKITEQTNHNNKGKITSKRIFKYDKMGNQIEIVQVDPINNNIIGEMRYIYDGVGNLIETLQGNLRTEYIYTTKTIYVVRYVPNGQVRDRKKYRFNEQDNIIEYYRESSDGDYWGRFTYRYDDQGLPIEKTWSRKEFIVQNPYELTKFEYEKYR